MKQPHVVSRLSSPASLMTAVLTPLLMLQGCTTYVQQPAPPPRVIYPAPLGPQVVYAPATQQVVSVYVDPPITQPAPIAVQWAPPPLLVEIPPPTPFDGAVWVGGYWHWEGTWVWARGRWLAPPRPSYTWVQPYYENRGGTVIFITGHWLPPGVVFVPPPPNLSINFAVVAAGVVPGSAPIGPAGVFIPPPPGSRPGLIVPAPVGTPPAVVTSVPPVVNVGMRVTAASVVNSNHRVGDVTNINNVTNISRVTNVTIVAPAGATASGQSITASLPAQAHLAAALPPVVRAYAPEPVSARPIPAAAANGALITLPPAQMVWLSVDPALQRTAAAAPLSIQHPQQPAAKSEPERQWRPPGQPARSEQNESTSKRNEQARTARLQDAQKAQRDNRAQQQRALRGTEPLEVHERKPAPGPVSKETQLTREHNAKQGEPGARPSERFRALKVDGGLQLGIGEQRPAAARNSART